MEDKRVLKLEEHVQVLQLKKGFKVVEIARKCGLTRNTVSLILKRTLKRHSNGVVY